MRLKRTGFYPDMSNVNKNIIMEAKLISPPTYVYIIIKGSVEQKVHISVFV